MNINLPTILIYQDRESKTYLGNLPSTLRSTFGQKSLRIATSNRHNFLNSINNLAPSIIIIPEIIGEESFFSRHINKETQLFLKKFVLNGGMLVTNCASTYWMAQSILYAPPKGATKIRSGANVFNAVALKAYGPMPGISNGKPGLAACVPIELLVKTQNGVESDLCWYHNGPGLFPVNNKLPSNIDIIARYRNIEDQPIAACAVYEGKGQYLMSGPLSHYHKAPVKQNNLLWRVLSHRMNQQLFEKQYQPVLQSAP